MLAKKAGESGMCEADYLRLLISQKPNDYPEVRELNTGKAILNSMIPDSISDGRKTEYNREIIRDRKEQPVR